MFGIFKLALFLVLVIAGIVFVPESFIDRMRDVVGQGRDYAARQLPQAQENIARQAKETERDAQNLYQKFQEDKWPQMNQWLIGKFIY